MSAAAGAEYPKPYETAVMYYTNKRNITYTVNVDYYTNPDFVIVSASEKPEGWTNRFILFQNWTKGAFNGKYVDQPGKFDGETLSTIKPLAGGARRRRSRKYRKARRTRRRSTKK